MQRKSFYILLGISSIILCTVFFRHRASPARSAETVLECVAAMGPPNYIASTCVWNNPRTFPIRKLSVLTLFSRDLDPLSITDWRGAVDGVYVWIDSKDSAQKADRFYKSILGDPGQDKKFASWSVISIFGDAATLRSVQKGMVVATRSINVGHLDVFADTRSRVLHEKELLERSPEAIRFDPSGEGK